MKYVPILFILTVVLAAAAGPSFNLPAPHSFKLRNGLTVYCLQDRSLPLVGFRLLIPGAGTAAELEKLEGSADLMAELLMKGAAGKSAQQVAEALDFTGASLQVYAAEEYLSISGQSLVRFWPDLVQLTSECLLQPTFSDSEFVKEIDRRIDGIKAIKDEPSAAVRFYFRKAYWRSHPLGRLSVANETSLRAMTVDDIRRLYRATVRPDQALLAVVGDIDVADLRVELEKEFSLWKKSAKAVPVTKWPDLPVPSFKRCLLVDKPDASQAYFILGAPGLAVGDANSASAQVMNTLFGGRFTSWLNGELRIKRGWTYGARSSLDSWKPGGLFTISSYTKNDQIGEMLRVSIELLNKAKTEGFNQDEMISGRNYVLGQFPLKFETLMSKARAYTDLSFYGLPFTYYTTFLAGVQSSTVESVHQQAQRLMPQDHYVLVVIGKADEIREQLQPFGSWEIRSISESGF